MGAARELQWCMAPLMTLKGDDVVEASLLRPTGEVLGSSPTPEEEAALLNKEDAPATVSDPSPRPLEIPRLIEPGEWATTPTASAKPQFAPKPHCHPLKREKKLWRAIGIDTNNHSRWVHSYMEKDDCLPRWWEEFCPLVCSTNGHCDDASVMRMACQQAAAFHLPATQIEAYGEWTAPPCLASLGRREYLTPRDSKSTRDYTDVQMEEIVALVMALQRCVIHA